MKTLDISGFGGSYESGCQKMLTNGLVFVAKEGKTNAEYTTYENIYGICSADNEDAKVLDAAILKGVDATGAMHQAVVNHLLYILKNGYEKWLNVQGTDQIDILDSKRETALKDLGI